MREINLSPFGLTKTEEAIYRTSLKIGPSGVRILAKAAGVKRSTSYYAIDHLIERGLLHQKIVGNKKTVEAEEPEHFFDILAREKSDLKNKELIASEIVPQLKALIHEFPHRSSVSFYEGKDNVWHIFEDILKEKKDPYWFGSFGSALKYLDFQDLLDRFSKKRRQFGKTKSFIISDPHPLAQRLWRLEDTGFREFRFLPEKIELKSAMIIYGNKVALLAFEEPVAGTILENKAIADTMRVMYQFLWLACSKKPKVL